MANQNFRVSDCRSTATLDLVNRPGLPQKDVVIYMGLAPSRHPDESSKGVQYCRDSQLCKLLICKS